MKHFFNELFDAIVSFKDGLIEKITVHLALKMLVKILESNPKEYMNQRPVLKARIDLVIVWYFWNVQRRVMVYFFPPALAWLVYTDPKLQSINTPATYLILCAMGLILGLLYDWAKPKE